MVRTASIKMQARRDTQSDSTGSFLPSLFEHEDYKKEVGIALIMFYFHATKRLLQARPSLKSIPPVLMSTVTALAGLNIINVVAPQHLQKILRYMDPSVAFLGNWMSLWLVPPLVLLPRAVRGIPRASASMWIRLALTHFGLFVGSTVVAAAVYKRVDRFCNGNGDSTSSSSNNIPAAMVLRGSSNYDELDADDDVRGLVQGLEQELQQEQAQAAVMSRREKEMKLLRFWAAVAAGFYAAAGAGVVSGTAPALTATSIAAFTAGQGSLVLSARTKRVVHPLLFTAIVSALAVVLVEKCKGGASRNTHTHTHTHSHWTDFLTAFTPVSTTIPSSSSSSSSGGGEGVRPGSLFSAALGPACTALAFRIFAQQKHLGNKLPAVLVSSAVTSVLSLFASPAIGRYAFCYTIALPSFLV
jgi:hypothetical protein